MISQYSPDGNNPSKNPLATKLITGDVETLG
jgi:hypothetical protein